LLCGLFLLVERRSAEPIIPLSLFTIRTIAISSIGGFLLGCLMFGITTYVPLYIQGVLGASATEAGFVLIPESLSWSLISIMIAMILRHAGYRRVVRLGTLIAVPGIGLLLLLTPQTGPLQLFLSMITIGCGLGLSSNVYTLSVQGAAPRELIGVASASTQFVRTIGGTIGVAVMGAILNAQIARRFAPVLAHFAGSAARLPQQIAPSNILLTPDLRASLPAAFLEQLKSALSQSLFWVYALMLALALVAALTMIWFPRELADTRIGEVSDAIAPQVPTADAL
jgi:Major Facilitator Superfamily